MEKISRRTFLTGALATVASPALPQVSVITGGNQDILAAYRFAVYLANNNTLYRAAGYATALFPNDGYDSLFAALTHLRNNDWRDTLPHRIEHVADVAYCINIQSATFIATMVPTLENPEIRQELSSLGAQANDTALALRDLYLSQGYNVYPGSCPTSYRLSLLP